MYRVWMLLQDFIQAYFSMTLLKFPDKVLSETGCFIASGFSWGKHFKKMSTLDCYLQQVDNNQEDYHIVWNKEIVRNMLEKEQYI